MTWFTVQAMSVASVFKQLLFLVPSFKILICLTPFMTFHTFHAEMYQKSTYQRASREKMRESPSSSNRSKSN